MLLAVTGWSGNAALLTFAIPVGVFVVLVVLGWTVFRPVARRLSRGGLPGHRSTSQH
jgi:hypothetical protein